MKDKYIDLINKGYTTKQIGLETNESSSTVKRNLQKLGLKTIHSNKEKNLMKSDLERLIKLHYSTYAIANELKCSQGCVRHALKKFQLKTNSKWALTRKKIKQEIKNGTYTCRVCKINKELNVNNFYIRTNGTFHTWCKECNNRITYEKQIQRKKDAVEYKGGKCIVCGYNKYIGALDFHHLDPSKKEFSIGKLRTYSLDKLKSELDKCVCVCRNCHAEIHHGLVSV
jgi:DNA-binding CsgD family transcriptional regulator